MKTLMFITIFLFLGAFFIISNDDISLSDPDGLNIFFKQYGLWIDGLFTNGGNLAGYLVKLEWLPEDHKNSS